MRFTERFLILLALISVIMRLSGMKDGATMELIALPMLALFYLIATPFLLLHRKRNLLPGRRNWRAVLISVVTGVGLAYCIISLMLYTLNWLPRRDMMENSGLILSLLLIILGIRYRKGHDRIHAQFILRLFLLLGCITTAFFLPFATAIPI